MKLFGLFAIFGFCVLTFADEYPFMPKDRGLFIIYDTETQPLSNNTLSYDKFSRAFAEKEPYLFKEFNEKFYDYEFFDTNNTHPVLFVYQPDEGVRELHGVYLPNGLSELFYPTIYSKTKSDSPIYKQVRDYFSTPEYKNVAVTPLAAKFAYPYLFFIPLVKIYNFEDVPSDFSVLFGTEQELVLDFADGALKKITSFQFAKNIETVRGAKGYTIYNFKTPKTFIKGAVDVSSHSDDITESTLPE